MTIHRSNLDCPLQVVLLGVLILFGCTSVVITQQQQQTSDSYMLDCGAATDSTDSYGRKWIPDSNFITTCHGCSAVGSAKSQDPSLPSSVPYMSARIFHSKSTYTFSVSPLFRHSLRLHFYPSSYNQLELDPYASFFGVTAAGFTLLTNFSASITADALTQAYIVRDFSLPKLQGSPLLHLTFTPSHNSFAFINGIEIISMPEIFHPAPMLGFSDRNIDADLYAMQTMFRMNVGGQYIADTWYDDSPYIYGAAFGVTSQGEGVAYPPSKDKEKEREWRSIAPLDVYRTARTMGPNATLNQNYNLTWIFEIDVSFTYLVRLHFCEFHFDKVNQRVFTIFINNQTAELEADVIAWSGGKGVPAYKDYATYVNAKDQLWLALHPNVEVKPEYYDSILNGVEVFKLNDTRGNLAGPNPVVASEMERTSPSTSSKIGMIVGLALGSVAALGLVLGLIAFITHKMTSSNGTTSWLPIYTNTMSTTTSQISSLGGGGGLCRHFTLAEIRVATSDFNDDCVVGVGGFGKVYKGYIDGAVAVKRANPSSEQGVHEFLNEIELLSKLRHRHLVSLIGACEENNEMILVYDYMANGTLRQHLYNNKSHPLCWRQRLEICIGAARGIHYLHTGAKQTIIHRDVKSTNILLDEKWVAKVSDFGLSKTRHAVDQTHVSTVVKGSFGYLDPEYFMRQQLTDKSDVYSFGVVLLEVVCGRAAVNPRLPKEQVSLTDWVVQNHRKNSLEEIIDPGIAGEIKGECLKQYMETAVKCLGDHSIDRPSMGEVLWNLEYCVELQNNPGGPAC